MMEERTTTTTRERRIAAWLAFLRAHSRVTAVLERELEDSEGLPMVWFDVLNQLRQAPGRRLRMLDLSEALAMTASGLSRRISRMEGAGLVERRPSLEDRRGVLVVLTQEGERRYRRALPVHLRGVERYFLDHLSAADADTLEAIFCRVLECLEEPAD